MDEFRRKWDDMMNRPGNRNIIYGIFTFLLGPIIVAVFAIPPFLILAAFPALIPTALPVLMFALPIIASAIALFGVLRAAIGLYEKVVGKNVSFGRDKSQQQTAQKESQQEVKNIQPTVSGLTGIKQSNVEERSATTQPPSIYTTPQYTNTGNSLTSSQTAQVKSDATPHPNHQDRLGNAARQAPQALS